MTQEKQEKIIYVFLQNCLRVTGDFKIWEFGSRNNHNAQPYKLAIQSHGLVRLSPTDDRLTGHSIITRAVSLTYIGEPTNIYVSHTGCWGTKHILSDLH